MALEKAEFRNRLVAALALHGKELKDLPTLLEGSGIPIHHAARMARPKGTLVPTESTILTLSKRLGVPATWFVEEDWRHLIGEENVVPPETELGLKRQEQGLEMIRDTLTRVARIEERMVGDERVTKIEDQVQAALLVADRLDERLSEVLARLSPQHRPKEGEGRDG